ncbi:glycosyltransferase family 2 protein [Magnetospirillum sp. 64-120]|uniref:glycosyltransferase n=1 Tax=Magnetospirillum sp. 64-120 TaxID=1895778 RepID=UPI0025BFB5FD|nr:glycosyltransferase family 2 protein [Magnetospirillum sp. 64-120]
MSQEMYSIVIVSYYTGPVLFSCLSALLAEPEVQEILIINNGNDLSDKIQLQDVAARSGRIRIFNPGRNIGFAAGCNMGAAQARTSVLAFVNPDLMVPAGTFAKLSQVRRDHADAWLFGGRLLDLAGQEQRGGRRETLTPWRALVEALRLDRLFPGHPYFRRFNLHDQPVPAGAVAVPAVSGAFMVIDRDRFDRLGGFDTEMFLHIEDLDLCLRVLQAGGVLLYCGHIPLYHQGGSSDASRLLVEWHKTRSTLIYFRKHFRDSYPHWVLSGVAGVLWLRFAALVPRGLLADAGRLGRRVLGRKRG